MPAKTDCSTDSVKLPCLWERPEALLKTTAIPDSVTTIEGKGLKLYQIQTLSVP